MKPLEEKQAKELFMFHALGNRNHVPIEDFNNICMKIIKVSGGLPLSFKLLGSFLCNTKKLEMWEGALNKLKSGQSFIGGNDNEKMWSVLKIFYNTWISKFKTCFWILLVFQWFENKYNLSSVEGRL